MKNWEESTYGDTARTSSAEYGQHVWTDNTCGLARGAEYP